MYFLAGTASGKHSREMARKIEEMNTLMQLRFITDKRRGRERRKRNRGERGKGVEEKRYKMVMEEDEERSS